MQTRMIGKYRIDGLLGEGAMGIVYRGFDETVGRAVAIKVVRKEGLPESAAWDTVARFRSEARAAGRLSHPNIVTVYDYAEDASSAHLVCEYVPGRGLDQWLAEHVRADLPTALGWMGQLLDALACAHAHGVVHRDVKASNILVAGRRLKLADFGIAQVDSADRTQVGLLIGTPSCMAPEQIRGDRLDGRVDVFAAGVLLYQLLTGERPFAGSAQEAMAQILTRRVPPPSQRCPGIPAEIDEAILRALARDPGERHASAVDFLEALRRAAAATGLAGPDGPADAEATRVVARMPPVPVSSAPPGGLTSAASPWDAQWLERVERELASHVGPIAALLVKKASRSACSADDLVSRVASGIADPALRGRLLGRLLGGEASGVDATGGREAAPIVVEPLPKPQATTGTPTALDDATVAGIEHRLTQRMGPLASVCIRRARRDASSAVDLCRRVAEKLPDPSARRAFLAECGADATSGDP
jgi:serine/threonine-protein kinase